MYIIKIKGKAKIPDYVQLRDNNYTLIAYFRTDRPERALDKCGLGDKTEQINEILAKIPFGKMHKIELE
ncbi:MAG: fructose-6-phosphate aldolase [Bacteroidia bacterium]|nr:fructose-6-phosphate aldolase [Bacteroidia bacterium]